jgi:hypothetical protein
VPDLPLLQFLPDGAPESIARRHQQLAFHPTQLVRTLLGMVYHVNGFYSIGRQGEFVIDPEIAAEWKPPICIVRGRALRVVNAWFEMTWGMQHD